MDLPESELVNDLLSKSREGDNAARDQLISIIYPELKRIGAILMSGERSDHTFGPTGSALVNSLYLRLAKGEAARNELAEVQDPQQLLRVLVRDMRQILIDHARAKRAGKRPAVKNRVPMEKAVLTVADGNSSGPYSSEIREALEKLAAAYPDHAYAMELKYTWGFTNDEGAAAMNLAVSKFRRLCQFGEAWLRKDLASEESEEAV